MKDLTKVEYYTAWERVKRAEEELENARKNFREIAGIICEDLMRENKDIFKKMAEND